MSVSVTSRNTSNYLTAAEAGSPPPSVPSSSEQPSCSSTTKEEIVEEAEVSTRNSPQKETEPRRKQRCYSSSESEQLQQSSSSSGNKRSRRHNAQQRGAKRRKVFNVPNEANSSNAESKANKALPRVPLTQQPKAPNNTTQFLITDREERESSDRDTTAGDSSLTSQFRPRCFSSGNPNSLLEASTFLLNSSDSDEEQEEEDSEFQEVYDNVSLERIQGLPREKVNREMLTTQKCNSQLVDKVTHLKSENQRLKGLLQQHGIDFARGNTNNAISQPFPISQKSRSTSCSEDNNVEESRQREEESKEE